MLAIKYRILMLLFTITKLVAENTQKLTYKLDATVLHNKQRESPDTDPYFHTALLFDTIKNGRKSFQHVESKDHIEEIENRSYKELSTQALHKTTTTSSLFSNKKYISLDDEDYVKNINTIEEDYIIDCNEDNNKNNNKNNNIVQQGDYYIGTDRSPHINVKTHANHGSKTGFIFSRQVLQVNSVKIGERACQKIKTVLVHPLELMDTTIETKISFPYERIIIPPEDKNLRRELSDPFIIPDPPLLVCTNPKFAAKEGFIHKNGAGDKSMNGFPLHYSYALDMGGTECLYADATVPGSINFNHGTGANAIRRNIDLGYGIRCDNCYSFIGASLLAVINIYGGDIRTFAFEVKDGGGAGFNLGLVASNPSFSGSKIITLAKAGPTSSIPIVLGLSLNINFDGAWATIKGSGSAKGSASFSSGYTLFEEDHIMYSKSRWSASHSLTNVNELKPVYKNNGLSAKTLSLSVLVYLSARINYSLGGTIPVANVGATLDFSTVLTASAQYIKNSGSSVYKYMLELSFASERRKLSETSTFKPGDKIKFHVKYSGLNKNENHELYLSLHNKDGLVPIMLHKFTTLGSDRGSVYPEWTVPHDNKFSQDGGNIRFSVHSSSRNDRFYSPSVKIARSRDTTESPVVFRYPVDGSFVPVNKNIKIVWNKNALKYFKHVPGTDGLGSYKNPENVGILVVCEDNQKNVRAYEIAHIIPNSGEHTISLPEVLRSLGEKFFLVIYDIDDFMRMAWQHGSFKLENNHVRNIANKCKDLEPAHVTPPIMDTGLPLWNNTFPLPIVLLYNNTNTNTNTNTNVTQRLLIGPDKCKDASLSILLQIEFAFDGFHLLGKKYSLGATQSNPFILVPQTNFCI